MTCQFFGFSRIRRSKDIASYTVGCIICNRGVLADLQSWWSQGYSQPSAIESFCSCLAIEWLPGDWIYLGSIERSLCVSMCGEELGDYRFIQNCCYLVLSDMQQWRVPVNLPPSPSRFHSCIHNIPQRFSIGSPNVATCLILVSAQGWPAHGPKRGACQHHSVRKIGSMAVGFAPFEPVPGRQMWWAGSIRTINNG